ncbi:uncharacterized protein LOC125286794 isoform X6 [Alosa alosa]|uniref:uncharacterized protein LOC125286794 isoform X6 n=1 Tax=Alosa alosa TaxID=278164 RepID=UPI0020153D51|nr:uncharacterized protein LOC125286794 isoform X6 [Alosa alosa]
MSGDGERSTVSEMSRSKEHSDFESVKEKRSESPTESSVSMRSDMSKGNMPDFREGEPLSEQSVKEKRSESPTESSVSMRSDMSKGNMPGFREGEPLSEQSVKEKRSESPTESSVSMRSDMSKGNMPGFREGEPLSEQSVKEKRSESPTESSVSMRSDRSKGNMPGFREGEPLSEQSVKEKRSESPTESSVSMRSDRSKGNMPGFREGEPLSEQSVKEKRSESPTESSVSMKSDRSKGNMPGFREGEPLSEQRLNDASITAEGCGALASALTSNPSHLIELNLSGIKLGDPGVKHISAMLHNPDCKLQKLLLSDCGVTAEGYASLVSALTPEHSHLVELDLRGNDPGDSGVKLISDLHNLVNDKKCKLQTLRLLKSDAAEKASVYLTSVLGTNPLCLAELNLSKKKPGDSGVKQLCALLKDSHCKLKKLTLNDGNITGEGCSALMSALTSNPSHLVELNLSGNKLGDSGVKYISALLKDPLCKLEKLELHNISITDEGCSALTSSLTSNPSHLIELNLSGNELGDSGVKHISALLESPDCELQKLLINDSGLTEKGCGDLALALRSKPTHLIELDLSVNKLGDSGVKHISALIENTFCKLQRLRLNNSSITADGCAALVAALTSNPAHLIELNLSGNKLGDSGVKHISALLGNPECQLQKLLLNDSSITEESCDALASALRSNPSDLIELNLSGNKLGDSGVKHISALLENPDCKLQKLLLIDSSITDKGCATLVSALKSDHSHLIELNLTGNELGDSGVNHISDLLKNPDCKLQKLLFSNISIADEGCAALTSALTSNPSHLVELNLSGNKLGDLGVLKISALLENPKCKLQKLLLSDCSITGDGYAALASALKSEHSHLIELDLRGNYPGHTELELVRDLHNLLNDKKCKLETLRLLRSDAAEEACAYLTSVLGTNSLLLTDLDLSGKKPGVKQFCALLGDSHCRLQKLKLNDCSVTDEDCAALTAALASNPSHLMELNLSGNKLGDSGVKHISALLQNPDCKLQKLLLSECNITGEGYAALASALKSNPSHLVELDLTGNDPGESGVELLTNLKKNPTCKLNKLRLLKSDAAKKVCSSLIKVHGINPLLVTELDLSGKKLGDSVAKQLSAVLEDSHCKLQTLKLADCGITGEGYAALASALKSNPSHLIELDLRGNDPGDSAVKLLTDLHNLVYDRKHKLKILRLLKSDAAEEASAYLTSVLRINPLLLTDLDLSKKKPGDLGVQQFCALLEDSHCKLKKLKLNDSGLTEEGCAALIEALKSNPSHLVELNLSGNELRDSGVNHISALLKSPHCKLQKLLLNDSIIANKGGDALTEAVTSDPLLHLKGNKLGHSGEKQGSFLLEYPTCKLHLPKEHCGCKSEGMKNLALKKMVHEDVFDTFTDLKRIVMKFMNDEWERFKRLLKKEKIKYNDRGADENQSAREAALNITLHFLKKINRNDLADTLENCPIEMCQRELKSNLKKKYECVFEGIATQGKSELLERIYTDLFITKGGSGAVNKEHEVRHIEKASGSSEEKLIECNNIFQSLPGEDKPIRTVLTKGVAGIGKSISVQKFILDWLKGNANQDIDLIFPLPFRELNLKVQRCSFMDILHQFFPETKGLMFTKNNMYKVLFVFDGLDECRHPLAFKKNEIWSDLTTSTSVDVLLTNLIKGNLFPSALIWITSRPAAAGCIPPDYIDQVAEIRGFNEEQKEEYFRKRITDGILADKVIQHMKESRSLYIMCHIPVFCWISATVLERILEEIEASEETESSDKEQTLKTLTQMYSHFLIFQTRRSTEKYGEKCAYDTEWDEKSILALGQLAFQNLLKNNLIFCENDLMQCGITVDDASVYSGVCTQIFKQDSGVFIGTAFCFVHLSIQEFFAALYSHMSFNKHRNNVFVDQDTSEEKESRTVTGLLKSAVDKALKSDSGHFDLFLRFLLGLSLESNQKLLEGLLIQAGNSSQEKEEIVKYIKEKFKENPSPERSINLFYCLNELNDKSLVEEIQNHLRSGSLSSAELSPAQWSTLVFVLMTSEEQMEEFDLQKYIRSDECLRRLLPVVKTATKAFLDNCNLTLESCSALATVLSSSSTSLKELNLSNNEIKDSGVQVLAEKLGNPQCKLESLRLSDCGITGKGYIDLAVALKSNPSHLKELDLTGNDPGDSGVKLLTDLLNDQACKLVKLRFLHDDAKKACDYLTKVLDKNPLLLTELDLSGNIPGDSGVKEFSALLEDSHCKLQKLKLNNSLITEEGCAALTSALCGLDSKSAREEGSAALTLTARSKPSCLIELNLSGNELGDSGVKHISALLETPLCKLQRLDLSDCSITGEGYAALASALKSNHSQLIELDLRGNNPGDSGVKLLTDLVQDPACKLVTLRLLKSDAAEEACEYLRSVLGTNPLLLKELDLTKHTPGDSEVKQLSALLEDSQCTLAVLKFCQSTSIGLSLSRSLTDLGHPSLMLAKNYLQLNDSSITDEGCAALTSALTSNPSHLIELNLSGNKLGDSGVKHISAILQNSHCKLKNLLLSDCNVTGEGYADLLSALKSNHSQLEELDLRGNDSGVFGVELLTDFYKLLNDQTSKLQTLRLLSDAAGEAFEYLTEILGTNPLLQTELDLSEKKPGDSEVKQFCALLGDLHCKLKSLNLNDTNMTNEGCAHLTSALTSNPSHLIELNLSGNSLGDSGVKQISALLGNPECKLQKLELNKNSIAKDGCAALKEALLLNPSHLTELSLSENKLGDTSAKHISALLKDSRCKLEKLQLDHNLITEEGCAALASALTLNISRLRELHLKGNKLGDSIKKIAGLQRDPNYKLQTLVLDEGGWMKWLGW